jgi:hypothetical protein
MSAKLKKLFFFTRRSMLSSYSIVEQPNMWSHKQETMQDQLVVTNFNMF